MQRRLVSHAALSFAAMAVSRAATVFAQAIALSWLGAEGFGVVSLAYTVSMVGSTGVGIGLGVAATKLLSTGAPSDQQTTRVKLASLRRLAVIGGVAIASVIGLFRLPLAELLLPGESQLPDALLLAALMTVACIGNHFLAGLLAGVFAFRSTVWANAWGGLAVVVATFASLRFGVVGVLCALLLGQCVTLILQHRAVTGAAQRCSVLTANKTGRTTLCEGVLLAAPYVLISSVNAPADMFAFACLAQSSDGLRELGVYNAASQWTQLLRFLPFATATALTTHLAQAGARPRGEPGEGPTRLASSAVLLTLAVALGLAAAAALACPLILALYGQEMAGRGGLLALCLATGVAVAVQVCAERCVLSLTPGWTVFWLNVGRCLIVGLLAAMFDLNAERLATYRLGAAAGHAILTLCLLVNVLRGVESVRARATESPATSSPSRAAA